jgi:hypothetical protein
MLSVTCLCNKFLLILFLKDSAKRPKRRWRRRARPGPRGPPGPVGPRGPPGPAGPRGMKGGKGIHPYTWLMCIVDVVVENCAKQS